MTPTLRACLLQLWPCLALPAWAQPAPAAEAPAEHPAAAVAADWEGVIGATVAYRPRYPGAPTNGVHAAPAFYLRYGRLTITNASGFAPRRSEVVARGLGLDVVRGDRLAASLSVRYDKGRAEKSTPAYAGLGNVRQTVRARLAVSYELGGPWRLGASWNPDVAGRGYGAYGDVSLRWEHHLDERTTVSAGAFVAIGDARYMQAYYGITPRQSSRSHYAAYRARAGVRDAGVSVGLRRDLARDWVGFAGASATRLLGGAAASPITRTAGGWGFNLGLGWRF